MKGLTHITALLLCLCWGMGAQAQDNKQMTCSDAATGKRVMHLYAPRLYQTDNRYSYVRGYLQNDTHIEGSGMLSIRQPEEPAWGFLVNGKVDGFLSRIDLNDDGYMDEPKHLGAEIGTHWQYRPSFGLRIDFGVRGMLDNRLGGQMGADDVLPVIFARDKVRGYSKTGLWLAGISDRSVDSYVDFFYPFGLDGATSLTASVDYSYLWMTSTFGNENLLPQLANIFYGHNSTHKPDPTCRLFDTDRQSFQAKGHLDHDFSERANVHVGASLNSDIWNDAYCRTYGTDFTSTQDLAAWVGGILRSSDLSTYCISADLKAGVYSGAGMLLSPELSLEWNPIRRLTVDGSFRRDLRRMSPLSENLGIMASGKTLTGAFTEHPLEDSWVARIGGTWRIRSKRSNYWRLDASYRSFRECAFTDYDLAPGTIAIVRLSELDPAEASFTVASYQWKHHYTPLKSLVIELSTRYSHTMQFLEGRGVVQRPMSEGFTQVNDVTWSPGKGKWTVQVVNTIYGERRTWDFMQEKGGIYKYGRTPAFTLVDAKVSRKAGGYEFFVDARNITGYRQPELYFDADNPFSSGFDASCIWGPTSGMKLLIGLKMDLMYR